MQLKAWMTGAWREPLVQFGVLGTLLYLALPPAGGESIRISSQRLEDSRAKMSRLLAGDATTEAINRESDLRVVGDELLYREALRLGLERDDPVIRQHLAQKLMALTEEAALARRGPTPAEERALFEELRERWTEPARITFCQVFSTQAPAADRLPSRSTAGTAECGGPDGEAFPLGAAIGPASESEIASRFGPAFAKAAFAAPMGRWSGPLSSRYGWHWIRVTDLLPAVAPAIDDRRTALRQAWAQRERTRARAELLRDLARRDQPAASRDASHELRRDVDRAVARLAHR